MKYKIIHILTLLATIQSFVDILEQVSLSECIISLDSLNIGYVKFRLINNNTLSIQATLNLPVDSISELYVYYSETSDSYGGLRDDLHVNTTIFKPILILPDINENITISSNTTNLVGSLCKLKLSLFDKEGNIDNQLFAYGYITRIPERIRPAIRVLVDTTPNETFNSYSGYIISESDLYNRTVNSTSDAATSRHLQSSRVDKCDPKYWWCHKEWRIIRPPWMM
jgi:hypothetical protein